MLNLNDQNSIFIKNIMILSEDSTEYCLRPNQSMLNNTKVENFIILCTVLCIILS